MGAYRAMMACLLAVALASCTTAGSQIGTDADAQTGDAIPPNYRELIVKYIVAQPFRDARAIRSARISSQPHVLWMGLLAGGFRKTICVEVIRRTILTDSARDLDVFAFKDGRILTVGNTYECEGLVDAPFNELLAQSQRPT